MNRPSEVTLTDIDHNKYSFASLCSMRSLFADASDDILAKFLVARDGDIEKASIMYRNHLEWKETFGWPVLKETIAPVASKGTVYQRGFDKEGTPIIVWNAYLHNAKTRDINDFIKLIVWWIEYGQSLVPKGRSKITLLVNRVDATNESSDLELVKSVVKICSDNYPETLKTCIIYPSSIFFVGIWNVVKIFLHPVTQAKVRPNYYVSGVKDFVDDQWIPVRMGGTDEYVFDLADYNDPYPVSVINAAKARGLPSVVEVLPDEDGPIPVAPLPTDS